MLITFKGSDQPCQQGRPARLTWAFSRWMAVGSISTAIDVDSGVGGRDVNLPPVHGGNQGARVGWWTLVNIVNVSG
jgi:hypothetical protein